MFLPLLAVGTALGQTPVAQTGAQPLYTITINVVEHTTKAINYQHRNGSTTIDFAGTPLLPSARGEAKVESKQGYMEVEVEFDNLASATRFGPEFLTYVMWAVTPEGRATNMGEVILNGTKSKLNVTTELQAFGMIVTAEPYFAVSQPSDVVVMENVVRPDTRGSVEEIEAKFELLERGQYTTNVLPADLQPIPMDRDTPLDLSQARNAVRIARWAGAEEFAADSFTRATTLLATAEGYKTANRGTTTVAMAAREVVQTAEDARLITLKNQADRRLADERAASAGRESAANRSAAAARAETSDADRARIEAEAATERTRIAAAAAAERAARDRAVADLARQQAARAADLASQQAARAAAEASEREKQELRDRLSGQLNSVLQTQDSARGLIVSMADVLFDTGQFALKPQAREMLSKISGIVLAYPSLHLEVEGHTDEVGSDELNMVLSRNRANAVREYLLSQGIEGASIGSSGFGESRPVATNDTSAGRQQNRRVELVVSGEAIGGTARPFDTRP